MAHLIEFYIPTTVSLFAIGIPSSERGKIIEFRARAVVETEAWSVAITSEVTQVPPAPPVQLESVNNTHAGHLATAFANALNCGESR